ncbi:MAG: SHOCT domain-containing protein [Clostridia bacterium]|nr:SHOCT domain-containing protein [Clostridia bacterium]
MKYFELVKFGIRDLGMSIALKAYVEVDYNAFIINKELFVKNTPFVITESMGEAEINGKLKEFIWAKFRKYISAALDKYGAESSAELLNREITGKLRDEAELFGVRLTEFNVTAVKMPVTDPLYIKYQELKNYKKPSESEILRKRDESYSRLQTSVSNMMNNIDPTLSRLMKLKMMFDSGLITETDYENKKAEILRNM